MTLLDWQDCDHHGPGLARHPAHRHLRGQEMIANPRRALGEDLIQLAFPERNYDRKEFWVVRSCRSG